MALFLIDSWYYQKSFQKEGSDRLGGRGGGRVGGATWEVLCCKQKQSRKNIQTGSDVIIHIKVKIKGTRTLNLFPPGLISQNSFQTVFHLNRNVVRRRLSRARWRSRVLTVLAVVTMETAVIHLSQKRSSSRASRRVVTLSRKTPLIHQTSDHDSVSRLFLTNKIHVVFDAK